MKNSKSLSLDELTTILRQIINTESGEIDRKIVKNILSEKILGGDRRQIEQILKAIFVNDRPRPLQQLVEHKIYLVVGKNSQTILHWAVEGGGYKCVRLLLNHTKQEDISVLKKDKFQVNSLHLAASRKSSKMLKLLLEELTHMDIEGDIYPHLLDSNSRSPLHYAASAGSLQCCEELIHSAGFLGLPIDPRDRFAQTPLMYAASSASAADVLRLLAHKKPVSVSTRNKNGMSALHLAVLARNLPAIRILLEELPEPNPNLLDNESRTPLHYASLYGYCDEIELLLKNGAIVGSHDQTSATPAHYAAQHSLPALKLLLENAKDVKDDLKDANNRSPLMWAVIAQNTEVVSAFLSGKLCASFTPNASDSRRQTALHLAAIQGNLEIYKMLLGAGWKETAQDQQSTMPIHLAAGYGHSELIKQFKKAMHNVNEEDGEKKTPLFYACLGGKAHTVKVMVNELGANKNHQDNLKQTALHCAAFVGSQSCCSALIELGCDTEIRDLHGRTPLDIARMCGKQKLVELFEQASNNKSIDNESLDTLSSD